MMFFDDKYFLLMFQIFLKHGKKYLKLYDKKKMSKTKVSSKNKIV